MVCDNGHRFEKPLVLKGKTSTRIVCPECKDTARFDLPEKKLKYKVTVELEDE